MRYSGPLGRREIYAVQHEESVYIHISTELESLEEERRKFFFSTGQERVDSRMLTLVGTPRRNTLKIFGQCCGHVTNAAFAE